MIRKHWFSILIVVVLCFVLLHSQKQNGELVKQVKELEKSNGVLVKKNETYLIEIDSLSNIDVEIIELIKYIKIKENEATIAVDTMSVSDLQKFFTKRYDN